MSDGQAWLCLSVAVVGTAFAHALYRQHFRTHRRRFLVGALALFGLVPVSNYLALTRLPIGTVYMATAVTQVLVLLLARLWFYEPLHSRHLGGMLLIVVGIILYGL